MTQRNRLPFRPGPVWTGAGLSTELQPTLTRDAWTRALFETVIGYGRHAWTTRTGLAQMVAMVPEPQTMATAILVQIADGLWLREGWPVPRTLGWLTVLAGSPDAVAAQGLAGLAGWGAEGCRLVEDWAVLDESLAPLAYAAGMEALEAYERQVSGVLEEATLRMMMGLRGYRLPGAR